jgi:hypothetical protein
MAYRCPVCDTPQVDAEHLANHLAFTAVLRGEAHETWLDDHVPDWGDQNPESLAPTVAEAVPESDVPEFDDANDGHDQGARLEDELAKQGSHRGPGATGANDSSGAHAGGRGDLTEDATDVLREARELTEQMYGLDDAGDADDADDAGDGDDAADANDSTGETDGRDDDESAASESE